MSSGELLIISRIDFPVELLLPGLKLLASLEKEQLNRDSARGRSRPTQYGPSRKTEFSVQVSSLLPRMSWQDLKDHLREHQTAVTYADVRTLTLGCSQYFIVIYAIPLN